MRSGVLVSGAVALAGAGTVPEVPWWGQLLMALVSVAMAFFGGRVGSARR